MNLFRFFSLATVLLLCMAIPASSKDIRGNKSPRNLCPDGGFESNEVINMAGGYMDYRSDLDNKWHLISRPMDGANANAIVENGQCHVSIESIGEEQWNIQLCIAPFNLTKGKRYRLTFDARSAKKRTILVVFQKVVFWDSYLSKSIEIDATMQSYSIEFEMTYPSDKKARMNFDIGNEMGDVWVDNIHVEEIY